MSRERKNESGQSKTTTQPREFSKRALHCINDPTSILPIFSFQDVSRTWNQKRSDFAKKAKLKDAGQHLDRRCGYMGCLDVGTDVSGILKWIISMDYMEYKRKQPIGEYQCFKQLVNRFMGEMVLLSSSPNLYYSPQFGALIYEDVSGTHLFSQLSAGYQSVLWLVMELAYRICSLNPNIDIQEIEKVPGIVLIDEIDMHLHPKWQWKIVDALQKTFPSVQFIAATHSPMIISSCKNANIIAFNEDGEIKYLPSGYGISVNDILELRLGSIDQPSNVAALVNSFEQAMDEGNEQARRALSTLSQELGEDHPITKSAKNELDLDILLGDI